MPDMEKIEVTHGDIILAKLSILGNASDPAENTSALTGLPKAKAEYLIASLRTELARVTN